MLTDSELQRELSTAFHEQADPISLGAIEPAALYRQGVRQRRRQAAARAGSLLAAAAAVAGVVALVTVPGQPAKGPAAGARPAIGAGSATGANPVARGNPRNTPGPVTTTGPTGVLLTAAIAPALPASAADRGMPPFYLVADHNKPVAVVRDSATGRPISTVRLPVGTAPKSTQVTATGDGRGFVLALNLGGDTAFYRLRITARGHAAGLTRLPVPPVPGAEAVDSVALSPDGTRFAVATQAGGRGGRIEVVALAGGPARTWTTTRAGTPEDLAWAGTGQLSYFWYGAGNTDGMWLLDTTTPGTRLLAGPPLLPATNGPDDVQDAWIAPGGRTIIASVTYAGTMKVSRGTVVGGIVAVSARTGRPLVTLLAQRAVQAGGTPGGSGWAITSCAMPSVDETGDHLLVSCDRFGRLDRGRFTSLPGAAPQLRPAAAW